MSLSTVPAPAEASLDDLRGAWDDLLDRLNRARDAIDSPEAHAPPVTDRGVAEGYRYLLGYLYAGIERALCEDVDFPYFRRAIQPTDKATIDNADALYLSAPIDGSGSYLVRGRMAGRAPRYVIFEAHQGYAGDSGNLAELSPATRAITGSLDVSDLVVRPDGRFEILLAPERPGGYEGNFIATCRIDDHGEHAATYLIARMLFHDWENEVSPELHIARIGKEGAQPAPLGPGAAAERIRRIGDIVDGQMRFWNEFYDVLLETHGDRNGDGETFMPRNDLNAPMAASLATGGGQSTNTYSGGVFEIAPEEALVVEVSVPVEPLYSGFHLANFWGESLDYANHVTSLNAFQVERDADGLMRYVVSHADPGVPNWLDTTGLRAGFMTMRWTYATPPEQLPETTVSKMALADVASHLPASTRQVSPDERRKQIRVRQEHVQRRYRQY